MTGVQLSGRQVADEGLDGWALLLGGLQSRLPTRGYGHGLALVAAIGAAAEAAGHPAELDLRATHVDVRLATPRPEDGAGPATVVTAADVDLARVVTRIALDAGSRTECEAVRRLELALDTPGSAALKPFWTAVLGMRAVGRDDVVDPAGALPTVWFQRSGDEPGRQRWHPDLWVDPAQVQPRIDAALAAGGSLVSEAEAPSFWVLADPEGNQVCLCTWQDRD